jgi:DNA-binding NtrC family response regulator
MNDGKILLVDNEPNYRDTVCQFLEDQGYEVITASDPASAAGLMKTEALALAVIDIRLLDDSDEKDETGLALAKQTDPSIPKIILTAFPNYQAVREAMKPALEGLPAAVGFVAKQEGLYKLLEAVKSALAPGLRRPPNSPH